MSNLELNIACLQAELGSGPGCDEVRREVKEAMIYNAQCKVTFIIGHDLQCVFEDPSGNKNIYPLEIGLIAVLQAYRLHLNK